MCIIGVPTSHSYNRRMTSTPLNENNTEISSETTKNGDQVEFKFKITFVGDHIDPNKNYYYREVVKTLRLTTLPSAVVTKWDVLPSESSDKNFLVLDITNWSPNELDLTYADSKRLVIEPTEACRIPLPIDR